MWIFRKCLIKKGRFACTLKYEGIKELELKGIILQRQVEAINVEGYVNSIPSYISVYVGNMKPGQSIFIGDLKIGDDIQVLEPKENSLPLPYLRPNKYFIIYSFRYCFRILQGF